MCQLYLRQEFLWLILMDRRSGRISGAVFRGKRRDEVRRGIEIKGHHINEGKPMVCVPIVAETSEQILAQAKDFTARGARMVEWRLDYYEKIHEDAAVRLTLLELGKICADTILLVTIRSKRQGGNARMEEEELIHLLTILAESGQADLLDVEFFELTEPKKLIQNLKNQGTYVIASHHDFDKTPSYDTLMTLLAQMEEGGADLVKIAVMPEKAADVLTLLSATNDYYERQEQVPIISMSMGKLGLVSRLSGQTFGSCVTFAVMGDSSAPGQPQAEALERVLEFMEERQ